MRERIIKHLDFIIYWSIVLIPFSMSIAPAPTSVFMGFIIVGFLGKLSLRAEGEAISKAGLLRPASASPRSPRNDRLVMLPLLFLFILTCLSIVNSVNYYDTIKGGILKLLQYVIIIFAVASSIRDKVHLKRIIVSVYCGIIFVTLDAVIQVMSGRDFVRGYVPMMSLGFARATASFKDPNTFGVYLSALVPLICGLTLYGARGFKRIALVIVTVSGLTATALTYSRPTLLAVYISLFILSLVRKNKLFISLLVIAALLAPFLAPKTVKDWAKQVDYNPARFMLNDDRLAIYLHTLHMIRAHPVIGVGANTYMKNYKKYKLYPEYRGVVTSDYLYAHNNSLHMAAEIGIFGLAAFIWFIFALFKQLVAIYRSLEDYFLKILSLSLIACVAAFLINGLSESSLYSSRVAVIFWFLAGLGLSLKKFCAK